MNLVLLLVLEMILNLRLILLLFLFFCREEADEYIDIGALNGIFVLGRSMGFIGK